ncbi:MAG: DUF4234 domain-containing protein [Polyangiales bacterium]
MNLDRIPRRSPEIVLLLSFLTCGLYLIYWYSQVYSEIEEVTGQPVTSTGFFLDLLFVILTCTLYGVWVDYRIAVQLNDHMRKIGLPGTNDPGTIIVILDLATLLTGGATNLITSAIQQKQLNQIVDHMRGAPPAIAATG